MLVRLENILLFLSLLFLPTQLGKHFWPDFAHLFSLRIDYLSPVIYFWDILVILLILVWIISRPNISRLAFNLFLVFLLAQIVSIFGSLNFGASLVRIEQYFIAGLFGLYIACLDKSKIKVIFLPILLSVIFESALAIMQFRQGKTLGLWILGERSFTISTPGIAKFDYQGLEFLRPYGTFPHPNVLAAFLIVSLIILSLKQSFRWLVINIVLTTTVTLLTASRAGIMAIFATIFYLLKPKWIFLFILLILFLMPVIYTRFSTIVSFDKLSLLRRSELDETALIIFTNNPFFGAGLNNFIPYVSNELIIGPSRFLQPVHNIYLLILAETGVLGFLGWLVLLGYPIFRFIKSPNNKKYQLLLAWIVILFLGTFDHYFLTLPQGYRMLFFIWGLTLQFSKLSE